MSYMGPRYSGGGQIFPQSQSGTIQPQQEMQRHYQMMQMQLQLQQKIQAQMQKQLNARSSANQNQNQNQNQNKGKPGSGPQSSNTSNSSQNVNKLQTQQQTPTQKQPQPQPQANSNKSNQGLIKKPNDQGNSNLSQQSQQTQQSQNKSQQEKNLPTQNQTQNFAAKKMQQGPGQQQQGSGGSSSGPNPVSGSKTQDVRDRLTSKNIQSSPSMINDKGYSPHFSNKQKDQNQPHSQSNQLPPLPPGPVNSSPQKMKQEVKNENPSTNMNMKGRAPQGQYNSPSNYNNSYDGGQGHNQRSNHPQSQTHGSGNQNFSRNMPNSGAPNKPSFPQPQKNIPPHNQESYPRGPPGRNMSNSSGGDYKPPRSSVAPPLMGTYKGGKGFYGQVDKIKEKVQQMFTGPITDLPTLDLTEKKFNAHAKLFIGNIPKNCDQQELVALFEKYGEIGPVYLNKDSSFAFITFDYKVNAAKAMRELDNTLLKNRYLKVRLATISEGIRIKNLSPYVSNELLEKCFSVFGTIESVRVIVDDRGMSKGEGIVIFKDKKAALTCVKKCQDECYFLSGAMKPVVVYPLEPLEDDVEGLPESSLPKNDEYHSERQIAPHFAESDSFEFEFGMQWKQLYTMYDEKKTTLDRDFQIEIERLEKKMVLAKVEYETEKLRKELAQREAESAELRRHFDFNDSMNAKSMGPSSGMPASNYDSYPGSSKRPLDSGYDSSFNGPYDSQYNDSYDRGGYSSADYDRGGYNSGYGSYGREDYRLEGGTGSGGGGGGYGSDNYDRQPYDHPADILPETRPLFDTPVDAGYPSNAPPEAPVASDTYKAPSKRPRY